MFIINLLYPLSVSVIAVVKGLRENFRERRSELFLIALFPLLPIIGGIIQTVSYGLSLIWPCVVISSMIILLHKGSHAILQDPLTGLNNRRSIGRLLKTYEEHQNSSAVLMILDLNNLKYINDHFGHSVGDQALGETANILRTTFRGSPAFLARFDGDEFLIAIPHGDEDLAEKTINKLRENFNQFQKTDTFPYPISVSIGYAAANQHNNLSLYDLLRHADESMYLDKEANRQHACNVKAVG
jgi:diguanylate cyclase (GGDEF)-like protein